jgi:hypothetical protein
MSKVVNYCQVRLTPRNEGIVKDLKVKFNQEYRDERNNWTIQEVTNLLITIGAKNGI